MNNDLVRALKFMAFRAEKRDLMAIIFGAF